MSNGFTVVVGCAVSLAMAAVDSAYLGSAVAVAQSTTITFATLPSFRNGAEALAVNEAGTIIAGHAWDRFGLLHAVRWTRQPDGSWAFTALPRPAGSTSAIARGVNNQGDVAGNDFPSTTSRAVLWLAPPGQLMLLDCPTDLGAATVYGISAAAQVVAGGVRTGTAAVWRPGSCREDLPPLVAGGSAAARAVNADGTIVGGLASAGPDSVPVRWRRVGEQWLIEQLDTRQGTVAGANFAGDLAGLVYVLPCASDDGCQRAAIWNVGGGLPLELGTLGGEDSWARDINASGEVVGASTSLNGVNTGYFWSASTGMLMLPFNGRWAAANAISDVRPDGTRLVAGMDSRGEPVVWLVRTN